MGVNTRRKYVLSALTAAVAALSVLSILVFALRSRNNISDNNREYLMEHTKQTALLVDDSLERGLANIQVLSRLVGSIITSPELDVALLQDTVGGDSIFDFIEFVDMEGRDHNITGGVSDAGDRQYYLDSLQGNSGVELIFNSRATNQTLLTYVILSRANRETQEALLQSEAASRAKTDFLFSMSHDLHTPINAIIGFLRLLEQRQGDPDECREYICKIQSASELLQSIVHNVLEMSRLEGGADAVNEAVWSAQQMTGAPCALISRQVEEKQITLETSIDVQHPFVWCDRAKLQEIYLNLLNNACQYTPSGGRVSVRLTELPSETEGTVLYKTEITDTGIGIQKEFMPHLFEPFARERDTTHSKIAGTGLGLPIVKRLTECMGGTVRIESEQGRGTRATVTLPHRIAPEPELQDEPAAPVTLSGKRVLLAEDNELNAEIAMELLREMGLTVDWARDGDICVAMVKESPPYDLILMDIQMPNLNGYQTAEAIRGLDDPAKAGIPIVAMTANAFEEDKQNATAAGMDDHLAKPIDISKLTQILSDILK